MIYITYNSIYYRRYKFQLIFHLKKEATYAWHIYSFGKPETFTTSMHTVYTVYNLIYCVYIKQ